MAPGGCPNTQELANKHRDPLHPTPCSTQVPPPGHSSARTPHKTGHPSLRCFSMDGPSFRATRKKCEGDTQPGISKIPEPQESMPAALTRSARWEVCQECEQEERSKNEADGKRHARRWLRKDCEPREQCLRNGATEWLGITEHINQRTRLVSASCRLVDACDTMAIPISRQVSDCVRPSPFVYESAL